MSLVASQWCTVVPFATTALLWELNGDCFLRYFHGRPCIETRLLAASPLKPSVWKRFIDDIFSLWNVPVEEVFVFSANSFHP